VRHNLRRQLTHFTLYRLWGKIGKNRAASRENMPL